MRGGPVQGPSANAMLNNGPPHTAVCLHHHGGINNPRDAPKLKPSVLQLKLGPGRRPQTQPNMFGRLLTETADFFWNRTLLFLPIHICTTQISQTLAQLDVCFWFDNKNTNSGMKRTVVWAWCSSYFTQRGQMGLWNTYHMLWTRTRWKLCFWSRKQKRSNENQQWTFHWVLESFCWGFIRCYRIKVQKLRLSGALSQIWNLCSMKDVA